MKLINYIIGGSMKSVFYYNSDIGNIGIAEDDNFITDVFFEKEEKADFPVIETPLIKEAHKQIEEYLKGKRKSFDLPIAPSGTEFQQKVWKALKSIPYGKTKSYKDIAIAVGNEKACRAVGMANNRNPISIIIPCHRVIGKNGKLVGYGGGIDIKEYLLKLESGNL
jgi:methylated-DNA-[protein]-cysteine S-methyltransferase